MNRFFIRILISIWTLLILTIVLTLIVGRALLDVDEQSKSYHVTLASKVANEIKLQVEQEQLDLAQIREEFLLNYDGLVEVLILLPDGSELLDRAVPSLLERNLNQDNPRFVIFEEGLDGIQVIGVQKQLPLGKLMVERGAKLLLVAIALVVSILVSLGLTRFIVKPISQLREAGHKVATGDLDVRVSHVVKGRKDDIALLAHDFDFMTQKLSELIEKKKHLMRDVSHELRSPLSRIQALLSLAKQVKPEDLNYDALQNTFDRMEMETNRLNDLIEQILIYAKLDANQSINCHDTDLVDLVYAIAEDVSIEADMGNKQIHISAPESVMLCVDSALIHSAIENVMRNAVRFTLPSKGIEVEVKMSINEVEIHVRDHGPGVSESHLTHIFEPFFRVESDKANSLAGGIGLAIVAKCMDLHGGRVSAHNHIRGGLVVSMVLPRQ